MVRPSLREMRDKHELRDEREMCDEYELLGERELLDERELLGERELLDEHEWRDVRELPDEHELRDMREGTTSGTSVGKGGLWLSLDGRASRGAACCAPTRGMNAAGY